MRPQLLVSETLVLRPIRQSWTVLLRTTAIASVALGMGLLLATSPSVHIVGDLARWSLWIWVGSTLLFALRRWFVWQRNGLIVTDQRLILQKTAGGKSRMILLDKITDVETRQTSLDRFLDEGALRIGLQGGGTMIVNHVARPRLLSDQIFVLAEALRNQT